MQTKYYLTFEQVGIIRRIPLKEQDPDMQGILNAPDDLSRFKGLLLEGNAIDHVTVAIKFESGADIKEAI